MKEYKILLVCSAKDAECFRELGSLEARSPDEAVENPAIAEMVAALDKTGRVGNPGRQVIARLVYPNHESWVNGEPVDLKGNPIKVPKSFRPPEVVQEFQIWPSAKLASRHLGFHNNEVAFYLNKVADAEIEQDRIVELRGVELQYLDDWNNEIN